MIGDSNITFRESSFSTFFNPTSTAPPFFQIFDSAFLTILGPNPSIREVASNSTFAFAHEAPVYVSDTNEVFFASNDGGPLGMSDLNHSNVIGKISLTDVDTALAANDSVINVPVMFLDLPKTIQMTNGGTGPYKSSLLLVTFGRGSLPPSIALVNPKAPNNVTVLLDNFFGRQFNSLNDIKVHPSGKLFFTDSEYGFLNHFRPNPLFPNHVYRLDPETGSVRVVATNFDKCNGIAFTADGNIAYISETGALGGLLGNDQTEPATIYAFDVDPRTHMFKNRRVFAYVDAGIPDGIQVDIQGNVYSGCGDGVQVWNDEGTLIGKFFLGTTSANMVLTTDGRLVIMAETKIFVAEIAAKGIPPISP
ncbi:Gluconolactonase [Termitomyces sp. T112]|nr:Gluconolactonase [Termitomyces sp. T112]